METLTLDTLQISHVYRGKNPKKDLWGLFDDRQVLHISGSRHPVKSGKKYVYTKAFTEWIKLKSTPPTTDLSISPDSEIWQMRYEGETKLSCIEYDYVIQYDSPSVGQGKHYPKISLQKFLKWASHDITDKLPKGEWSNTLEL